MNNTNVLIGLQISFDLLRSAMNLQASLGKAVTEGRDLTDEELNSFATRDDIAKARLETAIVQNPDEPIPGNPLPAA